MSDTIESRVICKQAGRYIGWPTIAKAPDGTLYAVFCGDRDAHVCPFGKAFLIKSDDNGGTWSEPLLVSESPLDVRDTGVCVCPDGTIVASWWTSHYADYREIYERFYLKKVPAGSDPRNDRWPAWSEHLAKVSEETIRQWAPSYETPDHPDYPMKRWLGFWTNRSTDGGKTWDEPALSPVYSPHGPTVLPNGDLLYVGMKALARIDGDRNIGVARSSDQGRSWTSLSSVSSFPKYTGRLADGFSRLAEPHVTAAPSGRLIAMARYEEKKDPEFPYRSNLWQFESEDGGLTWTEPHGTEIVGKPPHLTVLNDGNLLVTYGYRHAPHGQRACLSTDEGRTWDYENEIILRQDSKSGDLGYASSVECADGSIVSVYYQVDQEGERPSLAMTKIPPGLRASLSKKCALSGVTAEPDTHDPFTL